MILRFHDSRHTKKIFFLSYNNKASNLRGDKELQAWINEVSADGKPADGIEKEKVVIVGGQSLRSVTSFMGRNMWFIRK